MIYLIFALLTLVFFASLEGYKKIRVIAKNKFIEWLAWGLFCIWVLGFGIWGMSFLKNNYPELNRALAVVPVALGTILFLIFNRNTISAKGFKSEDE